uniref:Uncharacterized protein n=1 Tax=Trichogramma kaykai TaxID=54128 RepID=A0ABD2VXY2_9HYME
MFECIFDAIHILPIDKTLSTSRSGGLPPQRTSIRMRCNTILQRRRCGDYIVILHRRSKFYIGPARGQFFDRRPSETLCFLYGMMSGQTTWEHELCIQQTPAIAEHAISNSPQYNIWCIKSNEIFVLLLSFTLKIIYNARNADEDDEYRSKKAGDGDHGDGEKETMSKTGSRSNLTSKYGMHSLVNMYSDATARAGPCCNTSVGIFPRRRFPRDKEKNIIHSLCRANKIDSHAGSHVTHRKSRKRRRKEDARRYVNMEPKCASAATASCLRHMLSSRALYTTKRFKYVLSTSDGCFNARDRDRTRQTRNHSPPRRCR